VRTPSLLCQLLPSDQVVLLILHNFESLLVECLLELVQVDVCPPMPAPALSSARHDHRVSAPVSGCARSPFHTCSALEKPAAGLSLILNVGIPDRAGREWIETRT